MYAVAVQSAFQPLHRGQRGQRQRAEGRCEHAPACARGKRKDVGRPAIHRAARRQNRHAGWLCRE
uniref:Uncharacterized protein n=1 Tax=uncultured marine virus TaxID=186617 RepID=A0A0F7L4D2_9VIRU|nr:hypothetical protein [uncultured marine virus]